MAKQQFVELRLGRESNAWLYNVLLSQPPSTQRNTLMEKITLELERIRKQGGWDDSGSSAI